MKQSHRRLVVVSLALMLAAAIALGGWLLITRPPPSDEQFVPLDTVQIGSHAVQFYVDYGWDSAVLGFSVPDRAGTPRYFPMYGSTYRGLPAVTLEVFASDSHDELWVHSSWPGYEVLAYYRLGSDRCLTRYGETKYFDRPTPERLSGGNDSFPPMDRDVVKRVATIRYAD